MNWKRVSLGKWSLQTILAGMIAGLWAAVAYGLGAALGHWMGWNAGPATLGGLGLGLAAAGGLAGADCLLNRYWGRLPRILAAALPAGAVVGALGFWLADFALQAGSGSGFWAVAGSPRVALPLVLALLAGAAGVAAEAGGANPARGLRRGALGLLAGAIAALPLVAAFGLFGTSAPIFLAGFALWGGAAAWMMFWWEKKLARAWLRLLTGGGADTFFPLNGHRVTLGSLDGNDIPLRDFQEVFPTHCYLARNGEHFEIVDDGEGGAVQVNFRPVREQTLKDGDLIKVGTALLQYGEGP